MPEVSAWLDHVLAVPTIGLRWKPVLFGEHDFLESIAPVMEGFPSDESYAVTALGVGRYRVDCGGFVFATTASDVAVEFVYPTNIVPGLRAFPKVQEPTFQRYTVLLQDMRDRILRFATALPFPRRSVLQRIGIVANCRIERENPPPGLESFSKHLGSPWAVLPDEAKVQLRLLLASRDGERDRCHHAVTFSEETSKGVVDLRLDWQRYFDPATETKDPRDLDKLITGCTEGALSYFERFGSGDLRYAVD